MALDVPTKNVADTDMDQIECLLEQLGLRALSAALHTHDDVFVHDGMLFLMVQGKNLHGDETQTVQYASPPTVAAAGRVLFYAPAAQPAPDRARRAVCLQRVEHGQHRRHTHAGA
jgi:hypothetical protein